MSKRTNFASLIGEKPAASAADGGAAEKKLPPHSALMHTLVGNPENPRGEGEYSPDDPEFEELMNTLREVGQLQPVAVVSRDVFLRLKPQHAKVVGTADWVVVNGNRRYAAARQLGWTRVDIKVQDHLGDGKGLLDEAVIIENIHRKDIEPCKEAAFLQVLVDKYGSQDKVAQRIGKSQMYVSHRLSLLRLAPELQRRVDAGAFKLKAARELAARTADHDEQMAEFAEQLRQSQLPKAPKPAVQAPAPVATPVAPVAEPAPEPTYEAPVQLPQAAAPASPAPVVKPRTSSPAQDFVRAQSPAPEQTATSTPAVAPTAPELEPEPAGRPETGGAGTAAVDSLPLLNAALRAADSPEALVNGLETLTDDAFRQRVAELLLERL